MKIYNYSPISGEYISTTDADESPLETGEFLLPAHATTLAPPAPRYSFAAVFTSGEWCEVEDHRGETWFDMVGIPVKIETLGTIAAEMVQTVPALVAAANIKASRTAEIKGALAALDFKKIRPMAEGDATYLATLNAQSAALRAELASL